MGNGNAGQDVAQAEELGALVALVAVYAAGAELIVGALDDGRLRTGDTTLVGLRVLALDIVARLRARPGALADGLADLEATLAIAAGPRLARQRRLGEALLAQPDLSFVKFSSL